MYINSHAKGTPLPLARITTMIPLFLSEYTCAQAIMMSQTQVDFKAGECINPACLLIIQDRVTKATLQEAKVQEIME